jgi:hypothetical protein
MGTAVEEAAWGNPKGHHMRIHLALALAVFALTPVAATAETQEEQQACMNDAFNVCGDYIPDRERVAACLAQNISRISAPCRAVMARYAPQPPAASVASTRTTRSTKTAKSAKTHGNKGPLNIKPKQSAKADQRS